MELETIKLKDYETLPCVYDDDGNINKLNLKEGDYYLMKNNDKIINIGQRVSVYRVLRITPNGDESMMITLTVE